MERKLRYLCRWEKRIMQQGRETKRGAQGDQGEFAERKRD